jgi:hypothetical protein
MRRSTSQYDGRSERLVSVHHRHKVKSLWRRFASDVVEGIDRRRRGLLRRQRLTSVSAKGHHLRHDQSSNGKKSTSASIGRRLLHRLDL